MIFKRNGLHQFTCFVLTMTINAIKHLFCPIGVTIRQNTHHGGNAFRFQMDVVIKTNGSWVKVSPRGRLMDRHFWMGFCVKTGDRLGNRQHLLVVSMKVFMAIKAVGIGDPT